MRSPWPVCGSSNACAPIAWRHLIGTHIVCKFSACPRGMLAGALSQRISSYMLLDNVTLHPRTRAQHLFSLSDSQHTHHLSIWKQALSEAYDWLCLHCMHHDVVSFCTLHELSAKQRRAHACSKCLHCCCLWEWPKGHKATSACKDANLLHGQSSS